MLTTHLSSRTALPIVMLTVLAVAITIVGCAQQQPTNPNPFMYSDGSLPPGARNTQQPSGRSKPTYAVSGDKSEKSQPDWFGWWPWTKKQQEAKNITPTTPTPQRPPTGSQTSIPHQTPARR